MKLWDKKGSDINAQIEKFTVGRDPEFDMVLARYDVQGSIAHAKMLESVKMLSPEEAAAILKELKNIETEITQGIFRIEEGVEDIHSQIELNLTKKIGEAGKKIHSGRSRNDQMAVDIKLFLRAEIQELKSEVKKLFDLLISLSHQYKDDLFRVIRICRLPCLLLSGFGSVPMLKVWWMILKYWRQPIRS